MLSFIHAADLHLDSPLRGLERYEGAPSHEIREAGRRALANLVDHILENRVPLLLIAGDLYDSDCPDFQTLLHFALHMDRLGQAGTRVAIVQGNHDAGNLMTRSLKLPENVMVFPADQAGTWILDDLKTAVHGRSFGAAEVMDNLVPGYPDPVPGMFNIGILHTSLSGRPGHSGYAPCETGQLLARKYDYWALGHVHRFEVVHENPRVIFAGCIQGRHIREPGPKGCVRVEVDNAGAVHAQRVILDVFRWKTVDIDVSGIETLSGVTDRTGIAVEKALAEESGGRPMAFRINLRGACQAHDLLVKDSEMVRTSIRRTATAVSGGRLWVEKVILKTQPVIDFQELCRSRTPHGDLARFMLELENNPESFADLGFNLDDLAGKLAGTGVNLPDLDDPEERSQILEDVRRMLIPVLSKTSDSS